MTYRILITFLVGTPGYPLPRLPPNEKFKGGNGEAGDMGVTALGQNLNKNLICESCILPIDLRKDL